jgi:hypothetical protein
MEDTRTIKELAQEVMLAQNASNLTGLLGSWHNASKRLLQILQSTDKVNRHPINQMWAIKCSQLTGNHPLPEENASAYDGVASLMR